MPLMIFVVTIVALFFSAMQMHVTEQEIYATEVSEAKAVAANMIAYRNHVAQYVKYLDSHDRAVNYHRYLSYTGSAEQFLNDTPAGQRPAGLDWFELFPGVAGYIRQGQLYVYYKRGPLGVGPSEAGVQKELLESSHRSNRVGIMVP